MTESQATKELYRPTWVEVNVARIRENTRVLVKIGAQKGLEIMGVVKADGYGHGAVRCARAVLEGGASALAVALVEEGIKLREAGIDVPILVMGAYIPGTARAYTRYDLAATISDFDQARALCDEVEALGARVRAHLKIDTGMGRLGVLPPDAKALAASVAECAPVVVEGVYSHLATADEEEKSYAERQIALFEQVIEWVTELGLRPKYRHVLNTGGLLQLVCPSSNMARVGLALYGLYPSDHLRGFARLKPAMAWKTRIASVKRVPAGTDVSYGRTYRTDRETNLAVLPVGYANGFTRRLSHCAEVLIGGKRHPVVGRICMDQAIVDAGDAPVRAGDEVVLLGRQGDEVISAEEWADQLGTINYEIVCQVSDRVPRVYVEQPI